MNFSVKLKLLVLLGVISIFLILSYGCTVVPPDVVDEDYDNYIVSYIKVFPKTVTMNVNASKLFEVKAYDSGDNPIPVDPSEVDWIASYECLVCGQVWKFNPGSGSISTYFTPEETGEYFVFAKYKGKWSPNSTVQAE